MRTNFVTLACRAHYGAVRSPGTAAGRRPRSRSPRRSASPSSGPPGAVWRSCGSPICAADRDALRRGRGAPPAETGQPSHACGHGRLAPTGTIPPRRSTCSSPSSGASRWRTRPCARRLEVLVRAKVATGGRCSRFLRHRAAVDRGCAWNAPSPGLSESLEGLVAVGAGDHDSARARLEDAVELFATSGASFELARARLELARLLASLDRADAAVREAQCAVAPRRDWSSGRGSTSSGSTSDTSAPHRRLGATSVATQPHPTRGRDPAPRRGGAYGRRHRSAARAQQAHGSSPSSERLRQARLLLARRGGDEGEQAAPAVGQRHGLDRPCAHLASPGEDTCGARADTRSNVEQRRPRDVDCENTHQRFRLPACRTNLRARAASASVPASGSRAGADCSRR